VAHVSVSKKLYDVILPRSVTILEMSNGKIIKPTCGDSRTESDFLLNIRHLIETDPAAQKWHLIMDCLNTHQSESLVRLVAEKEGLDIDLGTIAILNDFLDLEQS
ncbi:transposase, partial [Microcoleus sp. AT3-A2]|uniref:transposase n=1 Tax=Microcoleus sp. AT3-A2 TaxID=2818610 RepID=UPI002FD0E00E